MSMTNEFPINWELDSLAPHPESESVSRAIGSICRRSLKQLAEESETLIADRRGAESASAWAALSGPVCGDIHARTEDLHAFIGCHAAADAENKRFQRIEAELSALIPLLQQILTKPGTGMLRRVRGGAVRFPLQPFHTERNSFSWRNVVAAAVFDCEGAGTAGGCSGRGRAACLEPVVRPDLRRTPR